MNFPAFFNLDGKLCVVIGGGKVAERKIRKLLEAGARIRVISPQLTHKIKSFVDSGRVIWYQRKYRRGDISRDVFFVFECTGDTEVAGRVLKECRAKKIFLNSATSPEISDFFVPAYTASGKIFVAISTGGSASAFARALREKIEKDIRGLPRKLNEVERLRNKLMSAWEGDAKKRKKSSAEDSFLLDISRWAVENPNVRTEKFKKEILKKMKKWGIRL